MAARPGGSYRNETPFFRLLVSFITGIIIQLLFDCGPEIPLTTILLSTGLVVLHTAVKKLSSSWKLRWIAGGMLQLAFFAAGMMLTWLHTEWNYPRHFRNVQGEIYAAAVTKTLLEKPASYKTTVKIISLKQGNRWREVRGNVLVYFRKDSVPLLLKYGDLIVFAAKPQSIEGPKNPEEFDYRQFLSNRQIYHQVFLEQRSWCRLPINCGNPVLKHAFMVRELFIDLLRKNIPGQREFAVASALITGYDDEVDQELIRAYSGTGVLHVLSVSGMHVGIIYQGLLMLFGFMTRKKWSLHVLYAFLICFIWFYAFITGFTPSVARSAVMLSLVIIARWHRANSNVSNTLIVTAFALLIRNPFYLTDVGFQLSFLAVWGIVYFHPKISMWYEPSGRLAHHLWELTSISMAAQLMTFPAGLFYFHQFPNYFMLSNLAVIPLSGLIIYLCIAVLALAPLPWFCGLISTFTSKLLWLLNGTVLFLDGLPGAVSEGISITVFETALMYVLIALVTGFLMVRKAICLNGSLLCLAVLITIQLYEKSETMQRKRMIVYDIPRHHAIDLINGKKHLFLADSALIINRQAMSFSVMQHWWKCNLGESEVRSREMVCSNTSYNKDGIFISGNFILFSEKKIFVAGKTFPVTKKHVTTSGLSKKMKIDFLIMSSQAPKNITDVLAYFDCSLVIIDSSVSRNRVEKWKMDCRQLGISCYPVLDNGAYLIDF